MAYNHRSHRRNRSLSATPPAVIQQHEFIPTRNAPDPPSSRRLAPSSSAPHRAKYDTIRSYGRFNDPTMPIQGETVSSPGTLMTPAEPLKKPSKNKTGGFGKLLKKLGNKQQQPDHHHHHVPTSPTSPDNPHNIPLAPPAPPPPKIPSIEVGQHVYRKPELKTGLQESDSLLSSIPAELRSRPTPPARIVEGPPLSMYNLPPPQTTSPHNANTNARNYHNSTNNNYTPNNAPQQPQPILQQPQPLPQPQQHRPSQVQQQPLRGILQKPQPFTEMPSYPIDNNIYNYQIQQQKLDEEEEEEDESLVKTQRFSRWSNASTGKSSGTYSLYSTFGPESRPSSESALDLQDDDDNTDEKQDDNIEQDDDGNGVTYVNNEISDDDDSSDDDDLFVDATGMSMEDIEREKNERRRLSKRLSGGHFGSAGGLMVSIGPTSPPPPVPSIPVQRRPSQDMVQSMLDWKRQSGSAKLELSNPPSSLSPPPRPVRKQLPEIKLETQVDGQAKEEPRDAADKIWNHDESFVPREKAAEWLGQAKPLHAEALVYYMNHFEFTNMLLDKAFRKLCSKLYFKAEAQQIDRILEAFARRFWQCNPQSIFGNDDIVYAVAYSLLLLNTDLHVAQGNHARMTRQAFVRNTMSTIRDQVKSLPPEKRDRTGQLFTKIWESDMEVYLKELYLSVKQSQILQPLEQQSQQLSVTNTTEKRASMLGGRRVAEFTRSVNTMIRNKSGRESAVIYPAEEKMSNPSSPLGSPRRDSFSSHTSGASFASSARNNTLLSPHQPMMSFMQSHASDLFTSRPPYLKEGVVVRKHLLENGNQKAKHREWRECFLVVGHGELKMYAMQGSTGEERRSMLRVNSFTTLADSLQGSKPSTTPWASSMQLLGTVTLNHSLSNILPPPGYNRQRPHVFAIQQSHGGVFLFQAPSQEQVNEWVETCNYWAARQSKEPLPGGVSNMEYGWGSCLNDVILDLDALEISGKYLGDPDALSIYDWRPPAPPTVSSTSDEQVQFDALQKHLDALSDEINEHRELKRKILVKFPSKSQNHAKVMTNWESKSNYLLHEIIKYQNYCDALERSVKRRRQQKQQQLPPTISVEQEKKLDLFSEIEKELHTGY
ncbi:hypothetical protein BJV82DRAFT_595619 [Fennellomyces sp. T-0311]|nr:hypothetical protein BJV82DRAFT_595619 [Fennellomyces sp. T-0311]